MKQGLFVHLEGHPGDEHLRIVDREIARQIRRYGPFVKVKPGFAPPDKLKERVQTRVGASAGMENDPVFNREDPSCSPSFSFK